jgi:hypothetical protein
MTLRRLGATSVAIAALLLPALATQVAAEEPPAARAGGPRLSVSPKAHVPGQAVRFRGTLPGARTVHLQSHLGRPGDVWTTVPGTRTTTKGGRFDFVSPAPSMFNIRYRVAGSGKATRSYLFYARPQEAVLRAQGSRSETPFHTIPAGSPYTVVVDTTPQVRNGVGAPPAIPGRTVSLQERVNGNEWQTLQQGTTDKRGNATFTLPAPPSGQQVLRVRQERWTKGANEVGWAASFPAYFTVAGAAGATARTTTPAAPLRAAPVAVRRARGVTNASQRYGWGPSLFDFAWTHGEDLDSRPSRGTKRQGSWHDTSDGTGRVTPYNGSLVLQSKLEHKGVGDLGTTTATMQGNAQQTGRWEFRVQGHVWERRGGSYRFRLELVPEGTPVATCVPQGILVAGFTMGGKGMEVGVRNETQGAQWRRSVGTRLGEQPMNVGVEVTRKHVTWFVEGRPVATLKDPQARLGAGLVPRLSMIGAQQEMRGSQVDSDWQRAWPLGRGKQVTSGPGLTRSSYAGTC